MSLSRATDPHGALHKLQNPMGARRGECRWLLPKIVRGDDIDRRPNAAVGAAGKSTSDPLAVTGGIPALY
jgi:hypothetical protein